LGFYDATEYNNYLAQLNNEMGRLLEECQGNIAKFLKLED